MDLKEVASGVEKRIKVKKQVACEHCKGSGAKDGSSYSNCSTCGGTGQVTRVQNTILGAMQTTSTCPTCQGEGRVITAKCSHCAGEGVVTAEEVITLKIRAVVAEGIQLSIVG
jgi:molecular chaperone DnaJ